MALVICRHCSKGIELFCYNTEGNRNSVVSQVPCRIDVTRLEQCAYIKIAVLRGRNARECHNELMEAVENNALHSLKNPLPGDQALYSI